MVFIGKKTQGGYLPQKRGHRDESLHRREDLGEDNLNRRERMPRGMP